MGRSRVVVTGMGLLTRWGGIDGTWPAVVEGRDGGVPLQGPEWTGFPVRSAAVIQGHEWAAGLDSKERRLDRSVQFALVAAAEAMRGSALVVGSEAARCGVIVGTSRGCTSALEDVIRSYHGVAAEPRGRREGHGASRGVEAIPPTASPRTMTSCAASAISIRYGMKGVNLGITATCASGAHAIGLATRIIQAGGADVMLAGGCEACVTPVYVAMAFRSGIASTTMCRPFDARRDGTLLGEGAGILVLEELDHAMRRGATILGEVVGYGASCDAQSLFAPSETGEGLAQAISESLRDAGVHPSEVSYLNAHGTATLRGDVAEARAINAALGEAAEHVPVSSVKPTTGHCVGAAGAIEAIVSILALRSGKVPPTGNFELTDPECRIYHVPPSGLQLKEPAVALSTSAGFGGTNACLTLRRFRPEATG